MSGTSTRLADLSVMAPGADPGIGLASNEIIFPMPTPLTAIVTDSGLMEMQFAHRVKTLALVVTTALTWTTAGQAKIQLFAARSKFGTLGSNGPPMSATATVQPINPFLGATGATSQIPSGNVPNTSQLIGTTANWGGASVTTLAAGIYWFSPTLLTELQYWYSCLGVEVTLPSAQLTGSYFPLLQVAPL